MTFSYKFEEYKILDELEEYIMKTYTEHYSGLNNVQAIELIASSGHGLGYCLGNVIKYASRYGKKNGNNREDLLKQLHYAVLALHCHDLENNKKGELHERQPEGSEGRTDEDHATGSED